MSLRVHYEILNQKGTPAFYSDTFANRPAFGFAGRVFISTDTGEIFEDTGSAWTLIADAGAGTTGTLQQVTTNGKTTNQGIVITAGNLGINTSSPGAPLDIHGTGTVAHFNGTGTNNAYVLFQNAGTSKWRFGNNYNAGANSLDFYNNTLASIVASFNGNGSLALNANLAIKQGTGINLISGYNNISCDSGGFFLNNGSANNAYLNLANLTASRTYTFPDASGTLALTSQIPAASQWTTSGSNIYYNTGNVGIGTASPAYKLHIAGDFNANVSMYLSGYLAIKNPSGNILSIGGINASEWNILSMYTNGNERMRISSAGNLIIGSTTDVGQKLQVTGAITSINDAISSYASGNGTTYGFVNNSAGALILTNSGVADKGSFNMSTGVYTPLSDINKKKDFEICTIGLNAILNLRPTLYRILEENNTEKHLGFIAQEVKQYIPQAYVECGNFIGLDYQSIVAVLVKSIQELNEKLVSNNIN
jgi:hypothetical protein